MAKVYGGSQYSIGIKQKDGSNFASAAATDTAYQLLPVINVSQPVLNLISSGEIRSNTPGMVELDTAQFRSRKGGNVTLDFEVPAERAFMVANVLQDHEEGGSGGNLTHTSKVADNGSGTGRLARPESLPMKVL